MSFYLKTLKLYINWNNSLTSLCITFRIILTVGNVEDELEELCGRVGDDGEGGHEVEHEHDLDDELERAVADGQHDVVPAQVAQGEVRGSRHREVDQEQNWNEKPKVT